MSPDEPNATVRERPKRLTSLDAYRGLIMVTLAGGGFGLVKMAERFDDRVWQTLAYHASHAEWISNFRVVCCRYWDLIQPSFMFMVGVAMAYSYARRAREGQSPVKMTFHAASRAAVLVLLAIFLSSNGSDHTRFEFFNVLAQIGLGYLFVYALMWRGLAVQLAAAVVILVGYWALFAYWPVPGPDFDYAASGIDPDSLLPGVFVHWSKNVHPAWEFDVWFLNLFPRTEPFEFNEGGYATLNFVPSIVTMLFGVMAGQLLQGPRGRWTKLFVLVLAGALALGLGVAASYTVCPIVKRIWTPAWVLFAGGWTFWILAVLYFVIDVLEWRAWSIPLVMVGMNSILVYLMAQTMRPYTAETLKKHFGQEIFAGTYGPVIQSVSVLAVFWLICWWLHRQKVFLRI
jgi:predicted acyltransferase